MIKVEQIADNEKLVAKMKERLSILVTEANQLRAEVRAKLPDLTDLQAKFQDLPGTIAELEVCLASEKVKLNSISHTDESVVAQYEKNMHEFTTLERSLERDEQAALEKEREMNRLHQRWYPRILDLTTRVSRAFGSFMAHSGCSGEVVLTNSGSSGNSGGNPNHATNNTNNNAGNNIDHTGYGLTIRVRFRAGEPLSDLSGSHQSGGEKALSTMLLLLSLQQVTRTPFRVVDEINQGLDAHFERDIFATMARLIDGKGGDNASLQRNSGRVNHDGDIELSDDDDRGTNLKREGRLHKTERVDDDDDDDDDLKGKGKDKKHRDDDDEHDNVPQYFIVTPKLLSNMEYGKGTTVLMVVNGILNDIRDENDMIHT